LLIVGLHAVFASRKLIPVVLYAGCVFTTNNMVTVITLSLA